MTAKRILINPPHSNLNEIKLEHTCTGDSKIWQDLEPISKALDNSIFQERKDWEFLRDFNKHNSKDIHKSFAKISKVLVDPANNLIFEEFFKTVTKIRAFSLERLLEATNNSSQTGEEILAFIFNAIGNVPANNREGKDKYINVLDHILTVIEDNPNYILKNCDEAIFKTTGIKVKFFTLDRFHDRLRQS